MKFSSFSVVTVALIFFAMAGCSSKSTQTATKSQSANSTVTSEPPPQERTSQGMPLSLATDIEGKAFSIDGTAVIAHAVISNGECRRPVFVDANRVAYANRRASLERWQVFEADFERKIERRVSFDAGDAEPVAAIGGRLVIASSSDERKSGDRLLNKYRVIYATPALPTELEIPQQHLLLEHPAYGRKGTEWVRMSNETARSWSISAGKELKLALALQHSPTNVEAYRIAMSIRGHEPQTHSWSQIKIEEPVTSGTTPSKIPVAIVDGKIWPDGKRIVWSNGSMMWTTAINGKEATRLGDESLPAANDLVVDPSGQWIVFSSPTPERGRNLMAVHRSGRCLKTLTELPGDEIEPAFSPDGTKLLFTLRQGDNSFIAEVPFGSPGSIAAACP